MSGPTKVSAGELVARLCVPGLVFALGWTVVAGLDFGLRSADGDLRWGGFPRDVWFFAHALLATASVATAWTCWRPLHPVWRAGLVVLQLCLGAPVYVFACVAYGLGLGLDGF